MSADGRDPWVVGWAVGGTVVAVAGGLLTGIAALARRVASQARTIELQLEEVRRTTEFTFDLPLLTAALDETADHASKACAPATSREADR